MQTQGDDLSQGAKKPGRSARIEWCGEKDGARHARDWLRQCRRWRRCHKSHNGRRSGKAVIGLIQQLAFGRTVACEQRMNP